MQDYKKIDHSKNKDVVLRYIPGHFITPNSHVNYYMDLTDMKSRQREARATGEELADPVADGGAVVVDEYPVT